MKKNTTLSYLIVIVAYILAIYIGKLSLDLNFTNNIYVDMLIADILATIVIFIFSILVQNSSMYDPYWSLIPVPIAFFWVSINPDGNTLRQWLVLGIILIWSIRLTVNWMKSWPNLSHEDWRYRKLAKDTGMFYWVVSFLGIHLLPTLLVFLGMIPVYVAVSNESGIGIPDIIGILIALSGIAIEYFADEQLRVFKNQSKDSHANMNLGLWSKTRHPNYLGEISFWLGLFIIALNNDPIDNLWTGTGFIAMVILFRFISIPMMEKRLVKSKKDYEKYKKSVPILFPRFFN